MNDVNNIDKAETHLTENHKSWNTVALFEETVGYNDEML